MIVSLAKFAATPEGILFGLFLAVVGLLVGVFGFALTLMQLKKVKTVSEAQRNAIVGLKFRLSQFDIIQECAKAERALHDIKSCLLNDGEIPLGNFDNLALSLVTILEGAHSLTPDINDRLQIAIADIDKMSKISPRSGVSRSASAKQAATFREYQGILVKIRAVVQREQQL